VNRSTENSTELGRTTATTKYRIQLINRLEAHVRFGQAQGTGSTFEKNSAQIVFTLHHEDQSSALDLETSRSLGILGAHARLWPLS